MLNTNLVPAFYMSHFAQDVSAPYTSLKAYQTGSIDKDGNILKSEGTIDSYEYFIIRLKKIFEELPPGMTRSKLSSYIPALMIFSEEANTIGMTSDQFNFFVEGYVAVETEGQLSYIELLEDMGTGGGAGAIGVPASAPSANQGGVSGFDPVMAPMQRRKSLLGFDNCEMFDVCPEEYNTFKSAEDWKNIPSGDTRNYLQRFQRRNKNGHMAVRNTDTGEIHWLQLKPKSLIEDVDLSIFKSVLNEKQDLTKPIEKLLEPVLTPPEEDKKIDGAAIERVGKLVHGVRALSTAQSLDSPSLVRDVERQLIDLSGKPISNNKKDAIDVDPETGNIVDLDIKGHNTTIGQRVDVGEYGEHEGLEDVMEPLQSTLTDVEAPPEVIETARKKAREALAKLSSKRGGKLKDIVLGSIQNQIPLSIFPGSNSKKFRFPFTPTLTPAKMIQGYVENIPNEEIKYSLRPSKTRAEVGIRVPDISREKSQGIFKTVAKNMDNGEMVSAQISQEALDNVLKDINPSLHDTVRRVLKPYTR
jgi:hypothetical protein